MSHDPLFSATHYLCHVCSIHPLDVLLRLLEMNLHQLAVKPHEPFVYDPTCPNSLSLPLEEFRDPQVFVPLQMKLNFAKTIIHYDGMQTLSIFSHLANSEHLKFCIHDNNTDLFITLRNIARGILNTDLFTAEAQCVERTDLQVLLAQNYHLLYAMFMNIDTIGHLLATAGGLPHYDLSPHTTLNENTTAFQVPPVKTTAMSALNLYKAGYRQVENSYWHLSSNTRFFHVMMQQMRYGDIPSQIRVISPTTLSSQKRQLPYLFVILDSHVLISVLPSERILLVYLIVFYSYYTDYILGTSSIPDQILQDIPPQMHPLIKAINAKINV